MNTRNIAVTLECFVKKNDKYLMLHRALDKRIMPGVWMAPGGHREFNEGLFTAARREVLEETGLTITNLQIKAHGNALVKDLNQEFYFHLLTADWASGELIPKHEDGELAWLTPLEILSLPTLLAELRYVLPHLFSDTQAVISFTTVYAQGNTLESIHIENAK